MLDVEHTLRHDGSLVAVRRDTGATITLPGAYVEASLELGYAKTAHRSQGITVDTGHTVVTPGRLTRERLYVSMTRGRSSNCAYVSEIDHVDHAALDPSLQPSWREILGEVLAAEGAERTAHEVREAELTRADSLERLSAEYDYLAQIAAAEDLARVLDVHAVGSMTALEQSPSWGAAVAAWRRSSVVARPAAERLVLEAAKTSTPAIDIVAVLQSRLRHTIDRMPAGLPDPITEPLHTNRSDLATMIREVRERMQRRMTTVATSALIQDDEWKQNLLNSLAPDTAPVEANRLVSSVAVFRDRWGIGDSPLPLGPIPSEYEWERKAQRLALESEVHRSTLHSPIEALQEWASNPTQHVDAANPAGWQL